MKLDKTKFIKQSHIEAANHQHEYNKMSDEEKEESFLLLMQASFGFVNQPLPKMDKTFFIKRSHDEKAETFTIEDMEVKVIHLNDLKIAKKSAGRYKDLDDLEHLP